MKKNTLLKAAYALGKGEVDSSILSSSTILRRHAVPLGSPMSGSIPPDERCDTVRVGYAPGGSLRVVFT